MKIYKLLSAAAIFVAAFSASATVAPGPDAFGHTGNSIGFSQRDTTAATGVVSGDDEVATGVTLPFAFNFYGNNFTSAWVSTNGLIGFDPLNAGSYCCNGDAPGVNNTISLSWMDWVTNVSSKTLGNVGSREFVLTWSGGEYSSGGNISAQMILHEGSNDIEFQYGSLVNNGHSQFIGISNSDSSDFLQVFNGNGGNRSQVGYLISTNDVPEPGSLALAGLGLAALVTLRKRRTA